MSLFTVVAFRTSDFGTDFATQNSVWTWPQSSSSELRSAIPVRSPALNKHERGNEYEYEYEYDYDQHQHHQ